MILASCFFMPLRRLKVSGLLLSYSCWSRNIFLSRTLMNHEVGQGLNGKHSQMEICSPALDATMK